MSTRPDDLKDDLLGARLESALGSAPPALSSRLEQLTAAGLRAGRPVEHASPLWLEVARQSASAAVAMAVLAGLLPRFLLLFTNPALIARWVAAPLALAPPSAAISILLPVGILLGVEALRGAPTVQRWVR